MADVAGILHLMRHAADRLDQEFSKVNDAFNTARSYSSNGHRSNVLDANHASYVASSTLATTVLRMVADFMTDPEASDG